MIDTEKLSRLLEELNIAVDGYAAQRLDLYAQRLVAWNEKMNLTGITGRRIPGPAAADRPAGSGSDPGRQSA